MTRNEVLAELSTYRRRFPREAVVAASDMWEEISDDLVMSLESTADDMEATAAEPDHMLHIYALFLCAEKREKRAFAPFLRILSHPDGDDLDGVLGDTLTEDSGRILASVYTGDLSRIHGLIENREADAYARVQGLEALEVLLLDGQLTREVVVSYLRALCRGRLEREQSPVWGSLVTFAAEIGAAELWPEVRQAFDDELVDPIFCRLDGIEQDLFIVEEAAMTHARASRHNQMVADPVAEMEWWAAFNESSDHWKNRSLVPSGYQLSDGIRGGTIRNENRKIGRNEPCPCGSGQKYKHCCGR